MQSCSTPDRHGYSVRFSPFQPNHLLLATSQLYGLAGGGTLFLLELPSAGGKGLTELGRMEWTDGLFDVVRLFKLLNTFLNCAHIIFLYFIGLVSICR